jgi:hypothetical protein
MNGSVGDDSLNMSLPADAGHLGARRIFACVFMLGLVLWAELLPIAGSESVAGSITGKVTVVMRSSRRLNSAGAYPGRVVGIPVNRDASELDNVVVFVDVKSGLDPKPGLATIRQTREEFVPHVLSVTKGSTVEFPNDDDIFHNVFSLSRAATFDLGRYPRNTSKARVFGRPGIVKVFCHLHSHMSAVVRVFEHQYFTTPDREGQFTIANIQAGDYEVVAWHERIGDVAQKVSVTAGQATEVSFSLPIADES